MRPSALVVGLGIFRTQRDRFVEGGDRAVEVAGLAIAASVAHAQAPDRVDGRRERAPESLGIVVVAAFDGLPAWRRVRGREVERRKPADTEAIGHLAVLAGRFWIDADLDQLAAQV